MNSNDLWQVFWETGAPEMYLMYQKRRRQEEADVYYHTGDRPESNTIQ